MKTHLDGRQTNRFRSFCDGAWQVFVLSLLAFALLLYASDVQAAQIDFSPDGLTVNVAPGETVTIPVTVSLTETTLPNSYASFGLAYAGGTLDRSWLNSQVYVSLNSWYKIRQVMLRLRVPADAQGGLYKAVLKTVWLRSNENVAPAEFAVNVEVDSFLSCSQVPLFSDISSSSGVLNVRNNKEVAIELAGNVSAPEECGIEALRYELIDEYGELDVTEPLETDANGDFMVSVPLVASRKGNDKDGRLYSVKFLADNEAGTGESGETTIVVAHDNRKK